MKMSSVKASYVYGPLVGDSNWKITFLLISVFLNNIMESQQTECDEYLYMKPTQVEDFYYNYRGLHSHTWCFSTAQNAELTLECPQVEMTKFTGWCRDTLNVSTTGNLHDAEVFCDRFQVTGKSIIMKLFSIDGVGTFSCKVKAEWKSPYDTGFKKAERIANGVPAEAHEFTSIAALIDITRPGSLVECGANLISNRLALTAAHCVFIREQDNLLSTNDFALLVGENDFLIVNDTGSARKYRIKKFVPHPGYRDTKALLPNDIAIIETLEEMRFDQYVDPVCLPFKLSKPLYEENAITAGWGSTESGIIYTYLQKASVVIKDPSYCTMIPKYQSTYSDENMVCIYGDGRANCQGDSGGPLYHKDQETGALVLIGITSTGIGCGGNFPNVLTRVQSYLSWIQEEYPGETFCGQ